LADSFPPPVLASHGMAAWVPTVEYSVSVRALPDTAWIKAVFRSHCLTSNIVEEDGELWDEKESCWLYRGRLRSSESINYTIPLSAISLSVFL
jgi:hypothetical protein